MSLETSSTNHTGAGTKVAPALWLQIDVRVSITDPRTGTAVPLGISDDQGQWHPLELGLSAPLDADLREAALDWLERGDVAGVALIEKTGEAIAALSETKQRCLLLAKQGQRPT